MYGVPGLNGLLRSRLLDFIRRQAKSKTYFSNTTYSIIYKLINEYKVLLFFLPSFSSNKFLSDGSPLQVIGGYDFDQRKIQIIVKWSFNLNALNTLFESHLPLICNKIFSLLLSEALLIYDYKHNGELSKSDSIKQWYKIYFSKSMADAIHRQSLTEELTDKISENYGARIFDRVEKAIIEGRSPSIKFDRKGENAELEIEGIPSIKKGKKELEDIWGDAIEDYVNEMMNNNRLAVDASAYQNLKQIWSDFAELGAFVYTHRDLPLDPSNIEAMPEDLEDSVTSKQDPFMIAMAKAKAKEEEKAEEDEAYKKYLAQNPKLKALIDKTADEQYDRKVQKYFHDFLPYDGSTIKTQDGRVLPAHVGKYSDKTGYVDPKTNESYISLFLMKRPCSLSDVETAVNGTKKSLSDLRVTMSDMINLQSSNANPQKIQEATELYDQQRQQVLTLLNHLNKLGAMLTSNTTESGAFYQPEHPALPFDRNMKPKDKPQEQPKLDLAHADSMIQKFEQLIQAERKVQKDNQVLMLQGGQQRLDQQILQNQLQISALKDRLIAQNDLFRGRQNAAFSTSKDQANLSSSQQIQSASKEIYDPSKNTGIAKEIIDKFRSDQKTWDIISGSRVDQKLTNAQQTNPSFLSNLPQSFIKDEFEQNTFEEFNKRINPGKKGETPPPIPRNTAQIRTDIGYMSDVSSHIEEDIRNNRMGSDNAQNDKLLRWVSHVKRCKTDLDTLTGELEAQNDKFKLSMDQLKPIKSERDQLIQERDSLQSEKNQLEQEKDKWDKEMLKYRIPRINGRNNGTLSRDEQNRLYQLEQDAKTKSITAEHFLDQKKQELSDKEKELQVKQQQLDTKNNEIESIIHLQHRLEKSIETRYHRSRIFTTALRHALFDYTKNLLKDNNILDKDDARSATIESLRQFIKERIPQYQQNQQVIGNRKDILPFDRNLALVAQKIDEQKSLDEEDIKTLILACERYPEMFKGLNLEPHVLHVLENVRVLDNKEGYARDLFINGLGFLYNSLPSWNTIKYYFNQGVYTTQKIIRTVKSIYRYAKVILPLKSNIMPYVNQKFGFGIMANFNYFDLAYKLTYKIKKMYELHKGTVRQNMVYSELYIPVTILQKVLYAHLVTQNDFTPEILYLLNCSNKGLEEFL